MRKFLKASLAVALALSVGACSQQGASNSAEATRENPMVLTLAHNMSETHSVHQAISLFADEVNKRTDGRIQIKIFANGQLGNEVEAMEQVMAGVIAMTKVSAPGLATYDDSYHAFGLPYIFNNTEDFYAVMDSDPMYEFFQSSYDKGFITLTYFTSGARSFYTVDRPIRSPADLHGMKIRVQDMRSQTEMVEVMGGTPVAMAYGDVFTSLQTRIIDGTENNETALTLGKHGEICKFFSVDEHAMIPDALLLSSKVWDTIAPEDQQILIDAARYSTIEHQAMWDKSVQEAIVEAENEMGVTFVYDVDKEAFRQATAGLVEKYAQEYEGVAKLLALIEDIRAQNAAAQAAAQQEAAAKAAAEAAALAAAQAEAVAQAALEQVAADAAQEATAEAAPVAPAAPEVAPAETPAATAPSAQ